MPTHSFLSYEEYRALCEARPYYRNRGHYFTKAIDLLRAEQYWNSAPALLARLSPKAQ